MTTSTTYLMLTYGDPPPDPDPLPEPGPGGPGVPGDERPRAATLQSIAIESKLTVCKCCQGIHHIQDCSELTDALFAPATLQKAA